MAEFLDFGKISKEIQFVDLLNFLNVPFKETKTELKTDTVIINKDKNLFFQKKGNAKGSVINFYSEFYDCSLRDSAKFLKKTFLNGKEPEREIPELELHYCKKLEEWGFSEEFCKKHQFGLVRQRSIMAKKIAFKIGENGYIGKEVKKDGWFYPKGFKRTMLYDPLGLTIDYAICVASALDCLHLINIGYPFAVALLANSATDSQIEHLKRFKRILLIHPEPENITLRLSQYCFVKAVRENSVGGKDSDFIKSLF